MPKHAERNWLRQPSWWIVLVSGTVLVAFCVAIVRELINGHNVRSQVGRLRDQVATETQRHQQLQDLIDYLSSPTFQEQEARLELGLKKNGERVIVVPADGNSNSDVTSSSTDAPTTSLPDSHVQRWWNYFFSSSPRS